MSENERTVWIYWCGEMRRVDRIVIKDGIPEMAGTIMMAKHLDIDLAVGQVSPVVHDLWVGIMPDAGWGGLDGETMLVRRNEISLLLHRLDNAVIRPSDQEEDDEDEADPFETISSEMIDLSDGLASCFGKAEYEEMAILLVKFAQSCGGWKNFRRCELRDFAGLDVALDELEDLGWLRNHDDGTFSYTSSLIERLPLIKTD